MKSLMRQAQEVQKKMQKIQDDLALAEFEGSSDNDTEVDLEDTMTLLSQYVDNIETEANKDKIKTIMKTLYVEAQNWEAE